MIEQLLPMAEGDKEIEGFINTVLRKQIGDDPALSAYPLATYEHIIDYLKSDRAPKRLRKMSFDQALRKSEEWTKSLQKKGANIIETEEDVEVIKVWKSSGMRFVRLIGKAAFKREGHLMRHCVGSYYGKSGREIYSLRDGKNMPHCTIEVTKDNGCIQQIKGKGNGSIHPKYIKYVIKMLERIGQDVNVHELSHLGYVELSDELWKLLDKCFQEVGELTFKNKRLYYKHSKPVLAITYDKALKITKEIVNAS